MSAQRSPKGFAVVDFETTGINPSGGDRAIEVGIVHVAPDGTLEDEAETLICVQRDLGASNLHHIHAADLMDAPDFAGIAAELRDWLDGYVFVAHNAVFDSRFLNAEYNRLGYATPVDRTTSICTLRLSNRFLGLRSLDDCCRELGIRNADAHSALGDAHATALLLSGFLHGIPDWEGWRPALRSGGRARMAADRGAAPPVDTQAEPCRAQTCVPVPESSAVGQSRRLGRPSRRCGHAGCRGRIRGPAGSVPDRRPVERT